jgi:hypothetical protein
MKAWEEHQHVLASYLSYEAWHNLRVAVRGVHWAHHLAVNALANETIGDTQTRLLAAYVQGTQMAQATLQPYLREPKGSLLSWMTTTINRRLLEPIGIRPRITGPPGP